MSERSFVDLLRDNQKTLYLWGILILVTLTGIFILISMFRPGSGGTDTSSASPAPSGDALNLMGKNVKDEGMVKGAQVIPPQTAPVTQPKASVKPTSKPTSSPTASPSISPSPTPTPSPSPTSSPTSAPNSPLSVSCNVTPQTANKDQEVTWDANASGGSGGLTYTWSGDDGLSGTEKTIKKTYTNEGLKNGKVKVKDSNNNEVESNCQITIKAS